MRERNGTLKWIWWLKFSLLLEREFGFYEFNKERIESMTTKSIELCSKWTEILTTIRICEFAALSFQFQYPSQRIGTET